MFAHSSALAFFVAFVLAWGVVLADEPRPPQPPLTGDTLREWRDDLSALHDLSDNAFLYEEAAGDFNRRLLAWQGANVLLSMRVVEVTKEQVNCRALYIGQITVRNQQQPQVSRNPTELGLVALRIGDVVPLAAARALRKGDTLVVDGTVAGSSFDQARGLGLAIERSGVVGVVSRSFAGSGTYNDRLGELVPVPDYPLEALVAGIDGEAIVSVAPRNIALTSGTGNPGLDGTVLGAMKRLGNNNAQMFPGEHRFTFEILAR